MGSVKLKEGGDNIFDSPDGLQELYNTGLLGALFLTIVGSISWQLVASAFPIAFLSNPLTYVLLRFALFLEATGLCAPAWVIAAAHKKIAGFQRDEVYIGTAEERAAKGDGDDPMVAGHMVKLPGFSDNAPKSLQKLLKKDPSVAQYIISVVEDVEKGTA